MEVPRVFRCQYVKLRAKLDDGRTLNWAHWVPNKSVDEAFGTAGPKPTDYKTAEEFAESTARGYMTTGIHAFWDGSDDELIPADKIKELTTSVEDKNLTMADIFVMEATCTTRASKCRSDRLRSVAVPRKHSALYVSSLRARSP
jgi:hypothetical protein